MTKITFHNGTAVVPRPHDGPIPALIATELTPGPQRGPGRGPASPTRPSTGPTSPSRCSSSKTGSTSPTKATADHLTGTQWGVMNETGSYPGQPWLWLYTLWYQVPGFDNSANVDLIAIYLTGAATILLLAVPFIPGLRDIPRFIPLHRLVWRSWDKTGGENVPAGEPIESANAGTPDRPRPG